jgi:undecaprenyl diphosphate synthase
MNKNGYFCTLVASLKENIDVNNLPQHIAVIMDGNGRWAKQKGAARIFGHRNAVQSVREITEGCAELGVKFLTLYAFSTENWGRPKDEVDGLMELLVNTLQKEIKTLLENQVKLKIIGDMNSLPKVCQTNLREAMDAAKNNSGLTLQLALSYSGRSEITNAVKKIAEEVRQGSLQPSDVNEKLIENYLETRGVPDPELLIRTSGEMRISNFLLWQVAYTELYITPKLWPDFRKEDLYEAICAYQKRERRFGKVLTPIA